MTENFEHIMVGFDFSDSSRAALDEAIRIARRANARLTILHVIDRELVDHMKAEEKFVDKEILEQGRERLREYIDSVIGCGLEWRDEVMIGYAFEELVIESGRRGIDLLVLGAGGTAEHGEHIGTLAKRCVRKLPAKVLLVRERETDRFGEVLACIDFSATSKVALEAAAQVAYADGANLHLLHVCPPPISDYSAVGVHEGIQLFETDPAAQPGPEYADAQKKALDALVDQQLDSRYPGLQIDTSVIVDRRPAHGIFEFLQDKEIDLVVLGTRGRTGLRSLLLGTVAEKVVNRAGCSVLAIKPEDFHYEL